MPSLTEGLRASGDGDLPPPFIMVWLGDKKGPDPPSPVDGFGFGRKYKANSNYQLFDRARDIVSGLVLSLLFVC